MVSEQYHRVVICSCIYPISHVTLTVSETLIFLYEWKPEGGGDGGGGGVGSGLYWSYGREMAQGYEYRYQPEMQPKQLSSTESIRTYRISGCSTKYRTVVCCYIFTIHHS